MCVTPLKAPRPVAGAALEIRDLQDWYGESLILHNVNISVRQGEVVTLLGRNGAGRTSTLKSVLGLVGRRTGSIKVNGIAGGCSWLNDSQRMLCPWVPDGRGAAPATPSRDRKHGEPKDHHEDVADARQGKPVCGGDALDGERRVGIHEAEADAAVHRVIDGKDISGHLSNGKVVKRLALTWKNRLSFVVDDKLQVRRLKFLDMERVRDESDGLPPEQQFEIDFALLSGEYAALLKDLAEAVNAARE